jgi:hypothetical protein
LHFAKKEFVALDDLGFIVVAVYKDKRCWISENLKSYNNFSPVPAMQVMHWTSLYEWEYTPSNLVINMLLFRCLQPCRMAIKYNQTICPFFFK